MENKDLREIIWQLMGSESALFMSRKERGVDIIMPAEELVDLGEQALAAINQHIYKEVMELIDEVQNDLLLDEIWFNEYSELRAAAKKRFLDE